MRTCRRARKVVHERVHENVMNSQRRMEKIYNRGTKDSKIKSGEWVWLRNEAREHRLSPMFRDPGLVIEMREVNLQLANSEGAKTQLVHLNRCKKASQTMPYSGSGTPTHLMQGNTDERLSKEVSPNRTHIETTGSPSTENQVDARECEGLNSNMDLLEFDAEQGDYSRSVGLRRSTRVRKEPDRHGEWT